MKQRTFGFATPEELSHHSIPEKGPRVVRGTQQGKQGEGGSDSIAPLNISPFTTLFGNGTRNFADGTHNFPNGTLFYQKGPIFPRWDSVWLMEPMFAGAYLSIRLAAARRSCRLLCAPFWAAHIAFLTCLSSSTPDIGLDRRSCGERFWKGVATGLRGCRFTAC